MLSILAVVQLQFLTSYCLDYGHREQKRKRERKIEKEKENEGEREREKERERERKRERESHIKHSRQKSKGTKIKVLYLLFRPHSSAPTSIKHGRIELASGNIHGRVELRLVRNWGERVERKKLQPAVPLPLVLLRFDSKDNHFGISCSQAD